MTVATPCTDRTATATATDTVREACTSRLATAFSWLADRLEHGARERARRRALRMTEIELRRLPKQAREDLGLPREVSPLITGLVGPADYWGGQTAGRLRDADRR